MQQLTTSEARAEAVTIALQVLIRRRMTKKERAAIYTIAKRESAKIGRADIADELAWLFVGVPQAEADMLRRDGCS
jgi:hypothetical protein